MKKIDISEGLRQNNNNKKKLIRNSTQKNY